MARGGRPSELVVLRGPGPRRPSALRVLRCRSASTDVSLQSRRRCRHGRVSRDRGGSLRDVGDGEASRVRGRWPAAAMPACAIIALSAIWVGSASASQAQPLAPATASRVLVMPFETTVREPRSYWLGEGSAVILSDSLLALGLPVMRRDERLHSFELLHVPAVAGLSHATVIRVGQIVGASQVIVGTFALVGDTLTVTARPIVLDTGLSGPEISETGPLDDIFD